MKRIDKVHEVSFSSHDPESGSSSTVRRARPIGREGVSDDVHVCAEKKIFVDWRGIILIAEYDYIGWFLVEI